MEPMLKTTNDGQMDKTAEEAGRPHTTHSIEWCYNDKATSVTCNKAGTVEDVLRQSSQFRKISEKLKDKELVIVRDRKAISAHCPCSLVTDERLTLKYVKASLKQRANGSVHPRRKCGELVMFNVLTKGGKNIVKIMRNPAVNKVVREITVYAYKGEKVKQALRRDGLFLKTIFNKNCVLSNTRTAVKTEMSNLVDDLDGKTYMIELLNKSSPPESLEDAYVTPNESQRSDSDENQDPQLLTAEPENEKTPKKNQQDVNAAQRNVLREIPGSKSMQSLLSSHFKRSMKGMKTKVPKLSFNENQWRVEYGKSVQTSTDIKTMKKLMELSGSVCQVRIDGTPEGSGFLFFDKFVLTNAHVLKSCYNGSRHQVDGRATVNFVYESLDPHEDRQEPVSDVEVEEVVGFENCPDESGNMYDWALLRLRANHKLPVGLLTRFGFLPQSGGISIIGHPNGGVKKIDSCLIVSSNTSEDSCRDPFQFISHRFFEDLPHEITRQILAYRSCFYFGSSGSPVFDKYCRVVAMHSGGYPDCPQEDELRILEFGYPLSAITEHMIIQMVEQGRFDVLKAYLACSHSHHRTMMINVKKLVESRNNTTFKNAVNNSLTENDPNLQSFFEFFCQKEEPVPMDIDGAS